MSNCQVPSRSPASCLGGPGPGLRTATGAVGFARALRVAACSLVGSARILPTAASPIVVVLDHVGTGPGLSSPLANFGHGRGAGGPGQGRWGHVESCDIPQGGFCLCGDCWQRLPGARAFVA